MLRRLSCRRFITNNAGLPDRDAGFNGREGTLQFAQAEALKTRAGISRKLFTCHEEDVSITVVELGTAQ